MKLSIIVPVYNVEKYVARCLDSLLNQGLSEDDYEIICVNDGSTDHSLQICQQYESEHKNIHVYSQENQGVSAARNLGLTKASAEAVCFADSDDTIVPNGLSIALKYYSDNDVDLVRYWCRYIVTESDRPDNPLEHNAYFIGDGHAFMEKYGLCQYCYCYIIRRKFLLMHNIKFKNLVMAEDALFVATMLINRPQMIALSLPIYLYHINAQSATTNRNHLHSQTCVDSLICSIEETYSMASRIHNAEIFEKFKECFFNRLYMIISRMLTSNYSKAQLRSQVVRLKKVGVLPVSRKKGVKANISRFMMNFVTNSYFAYKIISPIYAKIFVPYILPKLDRNK